MKVGICGKMASGKTTLANTLCDDLQFKKYSLAKAVKDFANFLFDIPEGHKDRVAYQKVGDGGRKILFHNLWIDTLLNQIKNNGTDLAVIDDVRYENEVVNLKNDGWIIIKLDISDNLQLDRLKRTYPNDWETHANARTHPSESEVDMIPESYFDLIIESCDTQESIRRLKNYLNGMMASQ